MTTDPTAATLADSILADTEEDVRFIHMVNAGLLVQLIRDQRDEVRRLRAELDRWHQALREQGLPEDSSPETFAQHHRGNARVAADARAMGAEIERDEARAELDRQRPVIDAALDEQAACQADEYDDGTHRTWVLAHQAYEAAVRAYRESQP